MTPAQANRGDLLVVRKREEVWVKLSTTKDPHLVGGSTHLLLLRTELLGSCIRHTYLLGDGQVCTARFSFPTSFDCFDRISPGGCRGE